MKQRHTFIATVVTFLCLFVMSSMAGTISVPNASYLGSISYSISTIVFSGPGSYALGATSGWVTGFPNAGISMTSACSATYTTGCLTGGGIDLVYYFAVTGGNTGAPVNVSLNGILKAALSANNTGDESIAENFARLMVSVNGNNTPIVLGTGCYGPCSQHQSWAGKLTVPMNSGDIASVELTILTSLAEGESACPGPNCLLGSGWATAYVDPYIYVDPTTPNAGLYSIAVSQGIGNAPLGSTPEPSSLMLLGSGVFGLAGLLRRKISQ